MRDSDRRPGPTEPVSDETPSNTGRAAPTNVTTALRMEDTLTLKMVHRGAISW